jgi:competence protein ComEA
VLALALGNAGEAPPAGVAGSGPTAGPREPTPPEPPTLRADDPPGVAAASMERSPAHASAPSHGRALGAAALAALEDRLPPSLRGGRVTLDIRAVAVIGLLSLAAMAFGASYLLRARPETAPPERAVVVATPSPSSTYLVVDVEGKVRRPGVVRLAAGARVVDALRAAGGVRPGTDTTALNLARLLVDGEQILVGVPQAPAGEASGSSPTGGGASDLLDLNTATAEQLERLPGVGPVLAQRILDWRQEHGRFSSVDELQEVPGIGPAKFAAVAKKVRV